MRSAVERAQRGTRTRFRVLCCRFRLPGFGFANCGQSQAAFEFDSCALIGHMGVSGIWELAPPASEPLNPQAPKARNIRFSAS